MDDFNRRLGTKIKKVRETISMSQEKLAGILSISRSALSQIENGKREVKSAELVEISKAFNCSVDELLDLKKEPSITITNITNESPVSNTSSEIRINVPQKNLAKFKEVLLYILNKVGSKPNIGETVIYKLLYFIDFDFYEKYEEQLIGASYMKNHFGPTPLEFKKIVEEMSQNKEIMKVDDRYFKYPQTKYLPLREPDLRLFKANEIEMINDVLNRLSYMNAKQISEYSHNDVPWLTSENQAIIDYESVFFRTPLYSVRPDCS